MKNENILNYSAEAYNLVMSSKAKLDSMLGTMIMFNAGTIQFKLDESLPANSFQFVKTT